MTDKPIVFAVIFVIAYGIAITLFVLWHLYVAKTHVQKLYGKTAQLHNQLRDAQAITAETQQELDLVKLRTTRNYI